MSHKTAVPNQANFTSLVSCPGKLTLSSQFIGKVTSPSDATRLLGYLKNDFPIQPSESVALEIIYTPVESGILVGYVLECLLPIGRMEDACQHFKVLVDFRRAFFQQLHEVGEDYTGSYFSPESDGVFLDDPASMFGGGF